MLSSALQVLSPASSAGCISVVVLFYSHISLDFCQFIFHSLFGLTLISLLWAPVLYSSYFIEFLFFFFNSLAVRSDTASILSMTLSEESSSPDTSYPYFFMFCFYNIFTEIWCCFLLIIHLSMRWILLSLVTFLQGMAQDHVFNLALVRVFPT